MDFDHFINEARGFLNALRQLCEPRTTMWINSFKMQQNFESTVEWYIDSLGDDFICSSVEYIKYDKLEVIIKESIFDKIIYLNNDSVKKALHWHYIEYYGLASTTENESNPFHPLISETSALLKLKSDEYDISACFITPVGSHVVVTTIGKVK
jgi:hypothetical protein